MAISHLLQSAAMVVLTLALIAPELVEIGFDFSETPPARVKASSRCSNAVCISCLRAGSRADCGTAVSLA